MLVLTAEENFKDKYLSLGCGYPMVIMDVILIMSLLVNYRSFNLQLKVGLFTHQPLIFIAHLVSMKYFVYI